MYYICIAFCTCEAISLFYFSCLKLREPRENRAFLFSHNAESTESKWFTWNQKMNRWLNVICNWTCFWPLCRLSYLPSVLPVWVDAARRDWGTSGFLMAPKFVCFFKPWLSSYTSGFSMCFTRTVLEPCLASWRHQRACSGIFSDRESCRSMSINADGFSAATAFRGWDGEGE